MPGDARLVGRRMVFLGSAILVAGSLGTLGALMAAIRSDLQRTAGDLAQLRALTGEQAAEIARLESRLADARVLEEKARAELLQQLSRESDDATGEVRDQLLELEGRVQALRSAAEEHARALAAARQDEDGEARLRELMGPSVRVNGRHEVGSGTVMWSGLQGQEVHTFVLTAWHVVREDGGKPGEGWPLEIDFFRDGELLRTEPATVLAVEEQLDLALLRVVGGEPYPNPARLATREELAATHLFTPVVAIGCPLGYPPLPTTGQLTSRDKELEGIHYWMVNAPTIFGNSGGGIYAGRSRQMLGVLSRISAYKNMIDVAVPHMGLVVPLDRVYEWLDGTPWAFVYRDRLPRGPLEASSVPASAPQDR